MSFEVYEPPDGRPRRCRPPHVIITDWMFVLNAAAVRLMTSDHVLVLWDRSRRRVGLRPAVNGELQAYKVTPNRHSSGATIGARAFLRHLGWRTPLRQHCKAAWNKKEGLLEFKLMREPRETPEAKR